MAGHGDSLALAYAASDAYENANVNLAYIDRVLDGMRSGVNIDDDRYLDLIRRLHEVLLTNRTAPGMMKVMALADAGRLAASEADDPSNNWLLRRRWRKESERVERELRQLLATTLDALMDERMPYTG
jgi:hypothetical protein